MQTAPKPEMMHAVTAASPSTPHAQTPPPSDSIWMRARRWVYRGSLVGVAISIWVHLVLWIIAALVHVPYSNADAGGGTGEPAVEFAIMNDIDLAPPAESEFNEPIPASAESAPVEITDLSELIAGDTDPLTDQAIDTSAMTDLSSGSGDGLSSDMSGFGAAGGAGASFFGLEAQGRRFVYIIDVSGSMDSEAFDNFSRLEVTRSELSRSVSGLLETSEFAVLLFARDAGSLYARRWIPATDRNKIDARSRIASLATDDVRRWGVNRPQGTDPRDAFEDAFRMRPLPDALYFMTDGEFDEAVIEFIANLNRRARLPVHCVLFTEPDSSVQAASEPRMREIARQSGGRYTLVDGRGR